MPEPVRYLSLDDVVKLTGWTRQVVKNRASRDKWGRLKTRPPKYRMDHVLESVGSSRDTRVRDHLLARHT